MLFTIVYGVLSVVTWSAFVYKAKDLVHDWRNRELQILCLAIATFAAPFGFATPAIYERVDALLGMHNVATLIIYTSVATCLTCFVALLVSWSSSQSSVRLRHRLLVGYALATVAAMFVFFFLGHSAVNDTEHPLDFDVHYGHTAWVEEFLLVYQLLFTVSMVGLVRLCWRYAKAVDDRPWLRRGLRVVTIGAVFGLGYCLPKAVSLLWAMVGDSPLDYVNKVIAPMFASAAAALFAIGFTMPAWGVGFSRAVQWATDYRTYQRRYRLWNALSREFPDIALFPPTSRTARWTARDLQFLLGRQVVEIRDGQLALRPYYNPEVARIVRELAENEGLTGNSLEAVVEAAQIAAALQAKAAGLPLRRQQTADPYDPADGDLKKEGVWMTQVADAFRASPIVPAALARIGQSGS